VVKPDVVVDDPASAGSPPQTMAHVIFADEPTTERVKPFKKTARAAQDRGLIAAIERGGVQWIYQNGG